MLSGLAKVTQLISSSVEFVNSKKLQHIMFICRNKSNAALIKARLSTGVECMKISYTFSLKQYSYKNNNLGENMPNRYCRILQNKKVISKRHHFQLSLWARNLVFTLQMIVTDHEHLFKCYFSRLRASGPIIKELILLNLFLNFLFLSLVNSISLQMHESSRHNVNIQPQWKRMLHYLDIPDRIQTKQIEQGQMKLTQLRIFRNHGGIAFFSLQDFAKNLL